MLFRRPKKSDPLPTPNWIRWAVIALVAYAVISGGIKSGKAPATATNTTAPSLPDLSEYKTKIFPDSGQRIDVREIKPGSGALLLCGQEATIRFDAFAPDGARVDFSPSFTFRFGAGNVIPALDRALFRSRVGAQLRINADPAMAYGAPGFVDEALKDTAIRFEVELLDVAPKLEPQGDGMPPKMLEVMRGGTDAAYVCGEEAAIRLTLWDGSGRKLFSNAEGEKLRVHIGAGETMRGLEMGLLGLNGKRTLILPPAYQTPMKPGASDPIANAANLKLPLKQSLIIDVEAAP